MNPEEYLDRLIESREQGKLHPPVLNDEIAASLAAAESLVQLRQIEVPPVFADYMEASIRLRARARAQLNGEIVPIAGTTRSAPIRRSTGTPRHLPGRVWIAALSIAAVLVLSFAGILTAAAQSLPGDSIYSLKQAEYQFTLLFAGNQQNRASSEIDQLHDVISDLRMVVDDGRHDDAIQLALAALITQTSDSRKAVAALPAGSAGQEVQQELNSALGEEDQALRQLLNQVDWPMQLAFTHQLGVLGDTVPTITHIVALAQSNGTFLITLTGTHFAPNAELMIDGKPGGVMSKNTPVQLVAVISKAVWTSGSHAFGIRNPDGTVAQIIPEKADHDSDDWGNNDGKYGVPGSKSDDDNGSDD